MRGTRWLSSVVAVVSVIAALQLGTGTPVARAAATPRAECGPGSKPESGMQGRVPRSEVDSGRAAEGYTCNTELVARYGERLAPGGSGGFKTFRYLDSQDRECAFYDSTLLYPLNATTQRTNLVGVYVLDMRDSAKPVRTASLLTPAMQTPHESLSLNEARGLLAAGMGYPTTNPGFVDIYDVKADCRNPVLLSSTPFGILGHEGNFSPDGNTFWVTSTQGNLITALDISDPRLPRILWTTRSYRPHGLTLSDDGNTLFLADTTSGRSGMTMLDVTQIQKRVADPVVTEISHTTWPTVSIPQNAIPVTIGGHPYVVEIDEYARGLGAGNPSAPVGAGRIIDIADPAKPAVVSDLRLEVHEPENIAEIAGDPGASFQLQGYAGHYCSVPSRVDPGIVACSMIASGLRIFDIRDPRAPREIAYFNGPILPTTGTQGGAFAMSAPAFAPERGEIWYSDGNTGFYVVRVTNGVWPFGTSE